MPPRATQTRHGMTLLEISAVMVIAALLAATVIPAMGRADEARRGAGVAEIERVVTYARERAFAGGRPVGVAFDADAQTVALLGLDRAGRPEPLVSALGEPTPDLPTLERFGVLMTSVRIPGAPEVGGPAGSTVWFDHAGTPHRRDTRGDLLGAVTADCRVDFEHGAAVVVRGVSGLVEVLPP